jgi:hypothetical protein
VSVVPRNLNLPFLVLILALGVALLLAAEAGVDPRLLSVITGTAALGGLTFRLISTWLEVPVLVHVLTILLIALLLVGALGQLQLAGSLPVGPRITPPPLTLAVWPGIAVRCACVVLAVFWPQWIDRRKSPFRT